MRLLILLLLVATCQAQDLPPDPELDTDLHPVLFPPDRVTEASHIMTSTLSDILGEELAWRLGVEQFLHGDNISINGTKPIAA